DGQHILAALFFKFHIPERDAGLLAQRPRHFLYPANEFLGLHTYLLKILQKAIRKSGLPHSPKNLHTTFVRIPSFPGRCKPSGKFFMRFAAFFGRSRAQTVESCPQNGTFPYFGLSP